MTVARNEIEETTEDDDVDVDDDDDVDGDGDGDGDEGEGDDGDEDEDQETTQDGDEDDVEEPELGALYVVSTTKLVLLYVATSGLYVLYWFYQHWSAQRRAYRLNIQPLARAAFAVFFVHALFRNFVRVARHAGFSPTWRPESQATLFVGLSVFSPILSRVVLDGYFMPFLLQCAALLPLAAAQRVANLASGDPHGKTNAGLDAGSVIAGVLGVALWLLLLMSHAT